MYFKHILKACIGFWICEYNQCSLGVLAYVLKSRHSVGYRVFTYLSKCVSESAYVNMRVKMRIGTCLDTYTCENAHVSVYINIHEKMRMCVRLLTGRVKMIM